MSAGTQQQKVDPLVIVDLLDAVDHKPNEFGGWDFTPGSESVREGVAHLRASYVRVTPVDGDFAYGADVLVFTSNHVVVGSANLHAGGASSALIGAIASALWSVR